MVVATPLVVNAKAGVFGQKTSLVLFQKNGGDNVPLLISCPKQLPAKVNFGLDIPEGPVEIGRIGKGIDGVIMDFFETIVFFNLEKSQAHNFTKGVVLKYRPPNPRYPDH